MDRLDSKTYTLVRDVCNKVFMDKIITELKNKQEEVNKNPKKQAKTRVIDLHFEYQLAEKQLIDQDKTMNQAVSALRQLELDNKDVYQKADSLVSERLRDLMHTFTLTQFNITKWTLKSQILYITLAPNAEVAYKKLNDAYDTLDAKNINVGFISNIAFAVYMPDDKNHNCPLIIIDYSNYMHNQLETILGQELKDRDKAYDIDYITAKVETPEEANYLSKVLAILAPFLH